MRYDEEAPGIDGMTVDELPSYLQKNWSVIRTSLLSGRYQPKPVRRVEIPKASGGISELGVPTVLDRLIQQAVLQALAIALPARHFAALGLPSLVEV